MPDLALLTALPFESRMARRLGLKRDCRFRAPTFSGLVSGREILLIETGIRGKRLHAMAGEPAFAPRLGVLSAGLAGGLDPELAAGTVLTATEVLIEGNRFRADDRLTAALARAGARQVPLLVTSTRALATREEKRAAFERTGGHAVDMESGFIARFARDRGCGFAVLRGVSDPAWVDLPPFLLGSKAGLRRFLSIPGLFPLAFRALRARRGMSRILEAALAELPLQG